MENRVKPWLCLLAISFALCSTQASSTTAKLRTIVTTDGEADDRCSMIRFLLYANEWNVRGLIHSSSKHHWLGDATRPGKKWTDVSWLERQLDHYAAVYPNLKQHDAGYLTPEELKRVVFVGNIVFEGDMEHPTAGSDHIASVLLENDSSPIWLQAWGGANTIARALKTIQERHPEKMSEVTRKTRLFLVASQDTTTEDYILKHWPGIFIVRSTGAYLAIAYRWEQVMTPAEQKLFDRDWLGEHILKNHGPLCAAYEARKDGAFRSEGDSPAFLHLIDVGLRNLEQPNSGGWGGRFEWAENQWRSALDENNITRPLMRWATAFQNDWAARADWCVKNFHDANHSPEVRLAHALDLKAKPGEHIRLSARPSTDPDQNQLSFKWWHYPEAGTYRGEVVIESADQIEATFIAPPSTRVNDTIHIICEVTDDGVPPLTRYQRVIVTLSE